MVRAAAQPHAFRLIGCTAIISPSGGSCAFKVGKKGRYTGFVLTPPKFHTQPRDIAKASKHVDLSRSIQRLHVVVQLVIRHGTRGNKRQPALRARRTRNHGSPSFSGTVARADIKYKTTANPRYLCPFFTGFATLGRRITISPLPGRAPEGLRLDDSNPRMRPRSSGRRP